jgi:hypothetical protein
MLEPRADLRFEVHREPAVTCRPRNKQTGTDDVQVTARQRTGDDNMGAGVAVEVDIIIVWRIWKVQPRTRVSAGVLSYTDCYKQRREQVERQQHIL